MISRRAFLGGAIALTAVTALPADAFADAPTIYGDCEHDDAPGLNALLAGEPFRVVGEGPPMRLQSAGGFVEIDGGRYLMQAPLRISGHTRAIIANATFWSDHTGHHVLMLDESQTFLERCTFVRSHRAHTAMLASGDEQQLKWAGNETLGLNIPDSASPPLDWLAAFPVRSGSPQK